MDTNTTQAQNVIIESRRRMSVTGVTDIESFDDRMILLCTSLGELTVNGEGLLVKKLDVETGDLEIDGYIVSLQYSEKKEKREGSFFKRLFK